MARRYCRFGHHAMPLNFAASPWTSLRDASESLHPTVTRPVNRCWLDDLGLQSEKQILALDLRQERYLGCLLPVIQFRQSSICGKIDKTTYKLGLSPSVHVSIAVLASSVSGFHVNTKPNRPFGMKKPLFIFSRNLFVL
ncbi:hypothetical protein KCU91_g97, partial [Aureobasidium melanogenum]